MIEAMRLNGGKVIHLVETPDVDRLKWRRPAVCGQKPGGGRRCGWRRSETTGYATEDDCPVCGRKVVWTARGPVLTKDYRPPSIQVCCLEEREAK